LGHLTSKNPSLSVFGGTLNLAQSISLLSVLNRVCFRFLGACFVRFVTFSLSVPAQLFAWEDSSSEWPIICRVGH